MKDLFAKYGRVAVLFLLAVSLILELLPFAVELHFGVPPEERDIMEYHVKAYPYYSLIPYGYAVLPPLPIFALTCVCSVLAVISLFSKRCGIVTAETVLCAVCVALAALWIMMAAYSFTVTAATVTTIHAVTSITLFMLRGAPQTDETDRGGDVKTMSIKQKKTAVAAVSATIAAVSFALSYLFCCYNPWLAIKLDADPFTYFVESVKHMWLFKTMISLLITAAVGFVPYAISKAVNKRKHN